MTQLTHGSLRQLLEVFGHVQTNYNRGVPFPTCYHDAVRDVKNHHRVTYQTIGDFRRRLGLPDVSAYMSLLERWLQGDAAPLRNVIKSHTAPGTHAEIDHFFSSDSSAVQAATEVSVVRSTPPSAVTPSRAPTPTLEELRLRIPQDLSQRLSLAHMAKLGATREETAIALLNAGFEAQKAIVRRFLDSTVGAT